MFSWQKSPTRPNETRPEAQANPSSSRLAEQRGIAVNDLVSTTSTSQTMPLLRVSSVLHNLQTVATEGKGNTREKSANR